MPNRHLLTEDEKQRARSHRLDDPIVRSMLGGYLSTELENRYGVQVPGRALRDTLAEYIAAIDAHLTEAEAIAATFGPRQS